jgi:hypothetical protein
VSGILPCAVCGAEWDQADLEAVVERYENTLREIERETDGYDPHMNEWRIHGIARSALAGTEESDQGGTA